MNKSLTFKQYRIIDIAILAAVLAVSETLICRATNSWFPEQPYTVSVVTAVIAIAMMRWSGWAAIHAVLGGIVYCFASGGTADQYVIYAVGNCFALAAILIFKWLTKEKVRTNPLLSVVYTVAVHLLAQTGRWCVSMAFGGDVKAIVAFLASDALSCVFAVVIVLITRRLDGMFEDQKHYLFRLEKKREEERRAADGED